MRASINLITSRKKTIHGYPICVKLSEGQKRPQECIGHSFIEDWDTVNKNIFQTHENYFELYPKILSYKSKISKINLGNYTFQDAVVFLFSNEKIKRVNGFLKFFSIRINEKKMLNEPFDTYEDVKNVIKDYIDESDIAINDITYEWLNEFVIYKLQTGCKSGGVNSYLRTMRAVYKEAQRRESLNIKKDNPFIGVFKTGETKEVVNVSKENFKKLLNFNPKKSTTKQNILKMQRTIALWLFQFYIGGHDYVDISLLKWSSIKKGRIVFKRYKNRNKANGGALVDNVICEAALKIIEKYGTKRKDRVFSFIPDVTTDKRKYIIYRQNTGRSLRAVSKTLNFDFTIKTKTPRYVFRTYATELLIHDLIVMKLQGHKPEGVTYKYQGNISHKLLDDALVSITTI